MKCRACNSPRLAHHCNVEQIEDRYWLKCQACGSLNSTCTYDELAGLYSSDDYLLHNLRHSGDRETHARQFTYYRDCLKLLCRPGDRVLDVGCLECCAVELYQAAGFEAWGFDVHPGMPAYVSECKADVVVERLVVWPEFLADLVPRCKAVIASDVIEHVDRPAELLREMTAALVSGGLLFVSTPRVRPDKHPIWDQRAHLCIFSEGRLREMIYEAGFEIDENRSRIWPTELDPRDSSGQLYVCRKA